MEITSETADLLQNDPFYSRYVRFDRDKWQFSPIIQVEYSQLTTSSTDDFQRQSRKLTKRAQTSN
ncbi:unnamed protein product, partial [Didymodactylos carnosus]